MPSYKPPAEPSFNTIDGEEKEGKRQPTVFVPMDPKWADAMKLGESIEITLKGKLIGFSVRKREGDKRDHSDMDIAVDLVSQPYGDEDSPKDFEELAEA